MWHPLALTGASLHRATSRWASVCNSHFCVRDIRTKYQHVKKKPWCIFSPDGQKLLVESTHFPAGRNLLNTQVCKKESILGFCLEMQCSKHVVTGTPDGNNHHKRTKKRSFISIRDNLEMIDAGIPRDKAFWQARSTSKNLWTSIVNSLKSLKSKKMTAFYKRKKKADYLFIECLTQVDRYTELTVSVS